MRASCICWLSTEHVPREGLHGHHHTPSPEHPGIALLVAAAIDLPDGGSQPKSEIVGNWTENGDRDFGLHLLCPLRFLDRCPCHGWTVKDFQLLASL